MLVAVGLSICNIVKAQILYKARVQLVNHSSHPVSFKSKEWKDWYTCEGNGAQSLGESAVDAIKRFSKDAGYPPYYGKYALTIALPVLLRDANNKEISFILNAIWAPGSCTAGHPVSFTEVTKGYEHQGCYCKLNELQCVVVGVRQQRGIGIVFVLGVKDNRKGNS